MGNTLCKTVSEVRSSVQYVVHASAAEETWRYPRVDLALFGQEVAVHLEEMREEASYRAARLGDQAMLIGEHLWEIVWHVLGILYRIWRAAYHMGRMLDEIGAEAAGLAGRAPPVLLELLERAREA